VAEVRDDYSYVRVLAEGVDDPHLYCVYEGAVDLSGDTIDGFALALKGKVVSPVNQKRTQGLFGANPNQTIRVSPDGLQMFSYTPEKELVILQREPTPAPRDLKRAASDQLWREKCAKAKTWEGTIFNSKVQQSSKIVLVLTSAPDELGNLNAVVWDTARPKIRIKLSGALKSDDDIEVNGFALKFSRKTPGEGGSVLLGSSKTPAQFHLRLTIDGKGLIGCIREESNGAWWTEFVNLRELDQPE